MVGRHAGRQVIGRKEQRKGKETREEERQKERETDRRQTDSKQTDKVTEPAGLNFTDILSSCIRLIKTLTSDASESDLKKKKKK